MKLQNHPRKERLVATLVLFLDIEVVAINHEHQHDGYTHKGNCFGSSGEKNGCKHGK